MATPVLSTTHPPTRGLFASLVDSTVTEAFFARRLIVLTGIMGSTSFLLLMSNIFLPTPGSGLMMYANTTIVGLATFTLTNRVLGYRLLAPPDNAVLLVMAIIFGTTITVHADGSNTSPWVVVYMAAVFFTSIYFGRWFGLVAATVTALMYGGLMYLEYTGIMQYAPGYPEKQDAMNIHGTMFKDYLTVSFFGVLAWAFSAFMLAQLRRTARQLEDANTALAEMDRLKSSFLQVVSHDLRTPLTAIRAYAELLSDTNAPPTPDEQQKFGQVIVNEADRLTRMVSNLLDLEKIEAGKMEWTWITSDVRALLLRTADVFRSSSQEYDITFDVDVPVELPPVPHDADRLTQVITNLLSNAFKFTPTGGSVALAAKAVTSNGVAGTEISVSDTGPGIPADEIPHLFDRFRQVTGTTTHDDSRGPGSGLGLAIVREIIDQHTGRVWVESTVGEGSTFGVFLPSHREPATPPSA